jgi:hypothetical protein
MSLEEGAAEVPDVETAGGMTGAELLTDVRDVPMIYLVLPLERFYPGAAGGAVPDK